MPGLEPLPGALTKRVSYQQLKKMSLKDLRRLLSDIGLSVSEIDSHGAALQALAQNTKD